MICSKCGAECTDNQAFCLKCGNPIQLMADFNLIEKELASSIDEFMNEMENEEEEIVEEDAMQTVDVPLDEINMELKVMDVSRGASKTSLIDDDIFDEDEEEDITPVYVPRKNDKNKKKKSNKKLYAIIAAIIAVVAIAVGIIIFIMSDDDKGSENVTKDFSYYYTEADKGYKGGDFGSALDNALSALKEAQSDSDKIKARKLIRDIYQAQDFSGDVYMENLSELFELGEGGEGEATLLMEYYANKADTEGLLSVMTHISVDKAKEILGDKYIEAPETTKKSGSYNNFVTFEFTADKGAAIYYGFEKDGKTEFTMYMSEIEITEVGNHAVVTYAVSELGIPSYKVTYEYNITEGENVGPVVSPSAGTYTEPTEIKVQVPEGSKVYYTYDGTKPDANSAEYTEPIDMLRGVNTFSAIAIDKYGNESELTKVQFNLRVPRNETHTTGKDKVFNYYYNNGLIDDAGNQADGSVISITYNDVMVIDNVEYYIYEVVATSADGTTTTAVTYCAVNTYSGGVLLGLIQDGDAFIIPKEETDEKEE